MSPSFAGVHEDRAPSLHTGGLGYLESPFCQAPGVLGVDRMLHSKPKLCRSSLALQLPLLSISFFFLEAGRTLYLWQPSLPLFPFIDTYQIPTIPPQAVC